jgi:hypothetical protein
MKTVWPHIQVLLLCICIMLYGVVSDAGTNMGAGTFEMVICSGDGPVTVVMDASGKPIQSAPKSPSPCCDCLICGAQTTALLANGFQLCAASVRFSILVISISDQIPTPPYNIRPQTRGPPSATRKHGASAILGCGAVCKDLAA